MTLTNCCIDVFKHHFYVSFMRILRLREVARATARIALEFAPEFVYVYCMDFVECYLILLGSCAFSVSLLLTPLCCDDIHDVTPRVSALARCDMDRWSGSTYGPSFANSVATDVANSLPTDVANSDNLAMLRIRIQQKIRAISHIFPNNNLEDSFKMGDEDLNFILNKELDKEDLIPIPRESKIGKECDFPLCDDFQSFKTFSNLLFEKKDDFPSRNDESILKEEVHKETLKSSNLNPPFLKTTRKSFLLSLSSSEASEYSLDEFADELALIDFSSYPERDDMTTPDMSKEFVLDDMSFSPKELNLESLPKDDFDNDDDLFEMDSNNDEWKRILYGEDFERMDSDSDKTKDFDKSIFFYYFQEVVF
ncbi:hypothetical protein Tco_0010593 [Tanacetum coccineum]